MTEVENVERKLVTIRQIGALSPIPDADVIEMAEVDGWELVVKKGEFSVGDRCVYFEIDSLLPIRPEFEFLRKSCYRKFEDENGVFVEGFRLRTVRMRGQISQGMALPVASVFPDLDTQEKLQLGDDVTEATGVTKYENGTDNFPSFIRKTAEERIQNVFAKYKAKYLDVEFERTIKLNGMSMTIYRRDEDFGICSRNTNTGELGAVTLSIDWNATGIPKALVAYGRNLALQGELCGPGIQKNPEKLDAQTFFLFNIWDIDRQRHLPMHDRLAVMENLNSLGAKIYHVPRLNMTHVFREVESVKDLLAMTVGPSIKVFQREGDVYKAVDGSVSFKVINNSYLLKHDG